MGGKCLRCLSVEILAIAAREVRFEEHRRRTEGRELGVRLDVVHALKVVKVPDMEVRSVKMKMEEVVKRLYRFVGERRTKVIGWMESNNLDPGWRYQVEMRIS